jgi:hypothetical protein
MPLAQGVSAATGAGGKDGPSRFWWVSEIRGAEAGNLHPTARRLAGMPNRRKSWNHIHLVSNRRMVEQDCRFIWQLRIGPGALRAWFRAWVGSSLAVGGGLGAAFRNDPRHGGSLSAGWRAAPRTGERLFTWRGSRRITVRLAACLPAWRLRSIKNWLEAFLEGAALTGGAAGGGALGTIVDRALVPALLGIVLGRQLAIYLLKAYGKPA